MRKKVITGALQTLLFALLVYFVTRQIASFDLSAVSLSIIFANWERLLLSIGLFIVFYVVLSIHWNRTVKMVDKDSESVNHHLAFFASQPYKYMPSSIFTFSSRAVYAKKLGLSVKKSSLGQFLEYTSLIGTAVVSGGTLYFLGVGNLPVFYAILTAFVILVLIMSLLKQKEVKIKSRRILLDTRAYGINLIITTTAWIVAGLSFYSLAGIFDPNLGVLTAIGANALAFAVGILAVFAPGGIGARELSYFAFGVSVPSVVIWRLLTLAVDMLSGLVAIALVHKHKAD